MHRAEGEESMGDTGWRGVARDVSYYAYMLLFEGGNSPNQAPDADSAVL